jgi:hypothetical protein
LDLIAQRVFGLALGYEDLNDHDHLRSDPMLAAALSKDGVKGEQRRRKQDRGKALAGKSTLNRLELTAPDYEGGPLRKDSDQPETKKIAVDPESIDALLVDLFLEAQEPAPERIILDLDATDDTVYGNQEGRAYHGYYRDYCYLPLYVFCGEHLLCSRLRMRNARKRVQHRRLGRFGGGVGACSGAHSPALAGGEDLVAGRRRLLPRETDGMVRS